jgi:hypothetical protein
MVEKQEQRRQGTKRAECGGKEAAATFCAYMKKRHLAEYEKRWNECFRGSAELCDLPDHHAAGFVPEHPNSGARGRAVTIPLGACRAHAGSFFASCASTRGMGHSEDGRGNVVVICPPELFKCIADFVRTHPEDEYKAPPATATGDKLALRLLEHADFFCLTALVRKLRRLSVSWSSPTVRVSGTAPGDHTERLLVVKRSGGALFTQAAARRSLKIGARKLKELKTASRRFPDADDGEAMLVCLGLFDPAQVWEEGDFWEGGSLQPRCTVTEDAPPAEVRTAKGLRHGVALWVNNWCGHSKSLWSTTTQRRSHTVHGCLDFGSWHGVEAFLVHCRLADVSGGVLAAENVLYEVEPEEAARLRPGLFVGGRVETSWRVEEGAV